MTLLLPAALLALAPGCDPGVDEPTGSARRESDMQVRASARPRPAGSHDGVAVSLLDEHAERARATANDMASWQLPFQAKLMIVNLLSAAANDRHWDVELYVTPDARWGLPDRREVHARPIFAGDDGAAFFDALRGAASRFAGKDKGATSGARSGSKAATFACPPLLPAVEQLVRNGAEPMWCYYTSHDRLDWLVFRLVMYRGRAHIDYVGLFEERPAGHVVIKRDDPPPPLIPPIRRKPGQQPVPAQRRPRIAPGRGGGPPAPVKTPASRTG